MYFFYYPRPSQKTNPRQFCFIFTNLLSITCFGLRPDHMVYSYSVQSCCFSKSSPGDSFLLPPNLCPSLLFLPPTQPTEQRVDEAALLSNPGVQYYSVPWPSTLLPLEALPRLTLLPGNKTLQKSAEVEVFVLLIRMGWQI